MSNRWLLVVLEMLYQIKIKIEKPSYYCETRPKTKKWCETSDVHCIWRPAILLGLSKLPNLFDYSKNVIDTEGKENDGNENKYLSIIILFQTRINTNIVKFEKYVHNNHPLVSTSKMQFVIYHKSVQIPKIHIIYQRQRIQL